ncbi:hypothetical protein RFF05_06915 [Bengtsoniella intestinalis]|uniref:hypothetical protein n=1 Tax=Bengtsoniella intestinalis TaxID=3073143 RepID=UPI00391F99A0
MDYTTIISQMLIIIAILTVLVTIITEVVKASFPALEGSAKINIFVLVLSVVVTVAVAIAYCQIKLLPLTWYWYGAFIVLGIMVAYAAMFGYDKLVSQFSSLTDGGDI